MTEELSASVKEKIRGHAINVDGVLTHPFEALHMGNGDIGASINLYPHELKITLAKTDIWDVRYDGEPEKWVLKHDDLIAMMNEKHRDLLCQFPNLDGKKGDDYYFETPAYGFPPYTNSPSPKRAGAIRIFHPGLSNTKVSCNLDILTGILTTIFDFENSKLVVHFFIHKNENVMWTQVEAEGNAPWFSIILEKEPDAADNTLPLPEVNCISSHIGGISQTIPEGYGIECFRWDLAGAFPQAAPEKGFDSLAPEPHAFRLRQYCSLSAGEKTEFCTVIATTRDGDNDTFHRTEEILERCEGKFEEMQQSHILAWEEFWNTSGIELEDKELEATWYRNHFHYACALRRGAVTLGIGGNTVITDYTPWHGDCHMNHNFQKWYVTAFPTNHPEWIDIYADFIEQKMPIFEYQAELIFGIEGVYCDSIYFPIMVKEQCNINNYVGRALALTGWLGQPLWWHWEYMHDREWLKERAYPYLKKAAQFYWNYLEKYQDESGDIYPSIRIEEPGWTKDFHDNRNVISDLVMFKKTFERAIEASKVLDVDLDWRNKWEQGLNKVPPIEYGWDDGEAWIALDKNWSELGAGVRADHSRYDRWGGGGWAVFPGEYIAGDGDDELTLAYRNLIDHTDLLNPFYSESNGRCMYLGVPIVHAISSVLPAIRLGLRDKFDSIRTIILGHRLPSGQSCSYMMNDGQIPKEVLGYYGFLWYDWRSVENQYVGVIATTEMMLQSQDSIIRLFPLWPEGQEAAFSRFLARGGFVITAKLYKDGRITAELESISGLPCQIRTQKKVKVMVNGILIPFKHDGKDIVFDTEKGKIYQIVLN